jgi:hypothetical protein
MIKYPLLFLIKRVIKFLNLNKRFITKITPLKSTYLKIISILIFLKGLSNILKKYTVFKYLNIILRVLSFSSLFINFILTILIFNINIIGFDKLNRVNNYLDQNLTWLPNIVKDFIINSWNKFYWFVIKIWDWFVSWIVYIFRLILDILNPVEDKIPGEIIIDPKNPSNNKYGDIYNKEYLNNLVHTLDDYKFYILIALGLVAIGILGYTYWDSITNKFKKPEDVTNIMPDITPSPEDSLPSSGKSISDYPEGYLTYFSKKLGLLTESVKSRAKDLFNRSADTSNISSNVGIPKGLYREGTQTMWKGLPVPRVENYNGIDYYISLDKDGFINMFNSKIEDSSISIISPISEKVVGVNNMLFFNKISQLKDSSHFPQFIAKDNSIIHNLSYTNFQISQPGLHSTSVDESTLPQSKPILIPKGKERAFDNFEDIPLGPNILGDNSPSSSGSITPRQSDFNLETNWDNPFV